MRHVIEAIAQHWHLTVAQYWHLRIFSSVSLVPVLAVMYLAFFRRRRG